MHILSTWLLLTIVFCAQVSAQEGNTVESATINVDGYVKEEPKITDPELEMFTSDIKRQKSETALNKEKAKNFKVLKKSIEQLSETTEEYLEEKRAAKAQIAEYNLKVKCLQTEDKSPECAKYVK